jgi:predicted Zn-dependent protease
MWKVVLLKILEVLLIIAATVLLTPPLEGGFHKIKIWLADPASVLNDAAKLRSLSMEADLHSAVRKYESVLSRSNLDNSWKMRANQGLSRTYSDLSKIRYWRGLSRGDYPEKAQSYALEAERENPGQFDTELALAYSYAAYEAESNTMTITKQKVRELMASHPENLEVQYLAWMAGVDGQASFPNKSNAENISDSMILLDVALDQAMHAGRASDQGQRDTETKHAEGFYKRAAELSPNNPFTPFVAGYLAAATNHLAEARDFFRDALQREKEFPRARIWALHTRR